MSEDKLTKKKLLDGMFTPENSRIDNTQSIDDILGENRFFHNPWKASSKEELEANLKDMNLADMQALATKVGLLPIHDRYVLKARLVKEFDRYIKKRNRKPAPNSERNIDSKIKRKITKKDAERVNAILKEGK